MRSLSVPLNDPTAELQVGFCRVTVTSNNFGTASLASGRFPLSVSGTNIRKLRLMDAALDSTAGGRPNFRTTQWGLVTAASAEDSSEVQAALEELYRLYCYPVYAFIRRRGHTRQDAQDLTQDFFVHLMEKGTLARADQQRGRFRSFLLGALDYFLAHAAERAAPATGVADASGYFWMTMQLRLVTSLRRLKG
jgi:hypothetical protein